MKADIRDCDALCAITPMALSAYALQMGWRKGEPFGDYSDVYAGDHLPEIILPRTQRVGDYARVVARLINIFADADERDELSLYRDLATADRDAIRIRVSESNDGSLSLSKGVELVSGARDVVLAAACSLLRPKAVFRAGANREASSLVDQFQLGQTEQSSFAVVLLTPAISPPIRELSDEFEGGTDPVARRLTKHLCRALDATRKAVENSVGESARNQIQSFTQAINLGASANLFEALTKLIHPFSNMDLHVSWARTRKSSSHRDVFRFSKGDAPILEEAARVLREREPKPDARLFGIVESLMRRQTEFDGTLSLRTIVDDRESSVRMVLRQGDYEKAVQAHKEKYPVVVTGDLERIGQRWHLQSPQIESVIRFGSGDSSRSPQRPVPDNK